jgi:hypothetical protein
MPSAWPTGRCCRENIPVRYMRSCEWWSSRKGRDMEWSADDGCSHRDKCATMATLAVADARHWGHAVEERTQDRVLAGEV